MKLFKFNFDDSYPLTLGVADDYFTLSTRLKRLGRAPMQPRRRATWLLCGALLLSFAAALPLRLTARAQTEARPSAQTASETRSLRGTARDFNGKPVANAAVYIMDPMDNGGDPRAQTQTDAQGRFALDKLKIDQYGVVVFVDAGARGVTEKQFDVNSADDPANFAIKLPHRSFASLVLLDPKHHPVKGVEVRLFRVGSSLNSWMAMPRVVKARYRAMSDAAGLVKFPPLPMGMLAQFELADQISKPTIFGLGDLRGGQYAPLAAEDSLHLDRQGVLRSVTLVPTIRLEGRVTLGDGRAKGNVLILARRINAAEAAGNDAKREQLIAQTRSNTQGKYVMDGLRPGRYYVWVYPEKQLVKDYIGPSYERDLKNKTNRVDFQLSRGAIIQGVVVAKNTGKPVKGQTMWLFDSQENNQYVITDARGYFRFRALGGKQRLRVHSNGQNSPPPGFRLPTKSEFDFDLKNGEKREFKFALPEKIALAPIRGVVRGADGAAAANATVVYRTLGGNGGFQFKEIKADARGRFALPAEVSERAPVQLFADLDEQTTPQSVAALSGDEIQLQLAKSAWASLSGQVVDENKQPLAGAKVTLHTLIGYMGIGARETTSDAQGRYRFEHLRPGTGAMLRATKTGYSQSYNTSEALTAGQKLTMNSAVKRAPKTLSGTLYTEDGNPANGYQISASGQNTTGLTRKDGKFYLSQVFAGPITIRVTAPQGGRSWRDFRATGGDKNLVLRLSKAKRDDRFESKPDRSESQVSLIGKTAPAIQAARWSDNKAVALDALQGQTVLLLFDDFGRGSGDEKRALARALKGRAQVVGVQLTRIYETQNRSFDPDDLAKQMGFPIAVDAVSPTAKFSGWQTYDIYGQVRYAVIGRDGKVVYAGQKLDRAIELANAAI